MGYKGTGIALLTELSGAPGHLHALRDAEGGPFYEEVANSRELNGNLGVDT